MTPQDFKNMLRKTQDTLKNEIPVIIATEAVKFFQERFEKKQWIAPWANTRQPVTRGSLMLRSGALQKSVREEMVASHRIVIVAGDSKVPYAGIHNEGGTINHPGGTPFFIKNGKLIFVKKTTSAKLPKTKPHQIKIPQRQYMGEHPELNKQIADVAINELTRKMR